MDFFEIFEGIINIYTSITYKVYIINQSLKKYLIISLLMNTH